MPSPRAPALAPAKASARQGEGIFGPDWHKWRGATLEITLVGEPPLIAKLNDVRVARTPGSPATASLLVLDGTLRQTDVRELPWPPAGTVRVVRAP